MKAELLHHMRIAPAVQQVALAGGQPVGPAAGDLGLARHQPRRQAQGLDGAGFVGDRIAGNGQPAH